MKAEAVCLACHYRAELNELGREMAKRDGPPSPCPACGHATMVVEYTPEERRKPS